MTEVLIIAHNIRSTHNVGAIFRTAEGFGVRKIILCGYTPYPSMPNDTRLPHIRNKLTYQIHKTALGAEDMVEFEHQDKPDLSALKNQGYKVVALEQSSKSVNLSDYNPSQKIALLLGEEVHGIEDELLNECDVVVEIPMNGKKESFNVSVATGIALYEISKYDASISLS